MTDHVPPLGEAALEFAKSEVIAQKAARARLRIIRGLVLVIVLLVFVGGIYVRDLRSKVAGDRETASCRAAASEASQIATGEALLLVLVREQDSTGQGVPPNPERLERLRKATAALDLAIKARSGSSERCVTDPEAVIAQIEATTSIPTSSP